MAEIVNLRTARKRKARAEKERAAEDNRLSHGISKVQRDTALTTRQRDTDAHEGHRRERADDEG